MRETPNGSQGQLLVTVLRFMSFFLSFFLRSLYNELHRKHGKKKKKEEEANVDVVPLGSTKDDDEQIEIDRS